MFSAPVKTNFNGEVAYRVELLNPILLGGSFQYTEKGCLPSTAYQDKFNSMKVYILKELSNHKQLFRQTPNMEMLEAITPIWGFLSKGQETILSPYTVLVTDVKPSEVPCYVDFELTGLIVSRSTIRPAFRYIVLEKPKESVIDFDWGEEAQVQELEEVSDIPALADSESMELRDPASVRREMLEEKERVRNAFRAAEEAKSKAEELAVRYYTKYDPSDSESAFSEWASDEEDDDSE
jgi:hypothetical protein